MTVSTKGSENASDGEAGLAWRDTVLLPMKRAGEIAGLSPSSLYAFQKDGRLVFRRLGGRTLVVTDSLLKLVSEAEEWQPSQRGTAGRAKRIERARAARQD